MPAQQRQNLVLRVDDRAQHPVPLLKPDELDELARLVVDGPLDGERRCHIRVAQHLHGLRPLGKTAPRKPQQSQIFARVSAEEPCYNAILDLRPEPVQPHRHPLRALPVSEDFPRAEQVQLAFLR